MIRINLLPYREEIRKAKRQQFYVMAAMAVVLGVLVIGLIHTIIGFAVTNQLDTNGVLQEAIAEANKQANEIKEIKARSQALLGRKLVIESLQNDRSEAVHLLNELVRQTPDGVYLTSVEQQGRSVTLRGYTQSNSRVSGFMRNIEASDRMAAPVLVEVRAAVVNGRRVPAFVLRFQLVTPPSQSEKAGAASDTAAEGNES
jgi:type IV pilus assembly protein PilN